MPVVISHPTGNEFFRAAVKGLYNAGELQSVYTSLVSFPGTLTYGISRFKAFEDIRRRSLDKELKNLVHTHPWKEAGRLLSIKLKRQNWVRHETGIFSVDAVYRSLDKYVAGCLEKEKAKCAGLIYAYEDGAAFSFKKAKEIGLKTVYDLPIGYWRTMHSMLSAEKELNPEWADTLDGLKNSQAKLTRKDEEISLAGTIIVASSFTAGSLGKYPGTLPKIHVVPYGFPPVQIKKYRQFKTNDKLKLLFVGGLSQRKGLSYLFEAMKGFKNKISLTIVGRGSVNNSAILAGNLSNHNWIESLPHQEVLALMQEHDVLIFPSLFEGFGQVITEAMAQGTPVITTERTAGPDIMQHNENGWIIKAGCVDAINNILQEIIAHPGMIESAGKEALETARQRPWSVYGLELADIVKAY